MTARQIIDAIDPKRVLRQVQSRLSLPKFLEAHGFTAVRPGEVYRKEGRVAKIRIVRQRNYAPQQEPASAWWIRVFALRPGMWELIYERTFDTEAEVISAITPYLASLKEAIDPKRVFRQVMRGNKLRRTLLRDRWEPFGSSDLAWKKTLSGWPEESQKRTYFVWWDDDAGQWIVKKEGQKKHFGKWCGWHDLGFSTWNTEDEVIKHLVAGGGLYLWDMV